MKQRILKTFLYLGCKGGKSVGVSGKVARDGRVPNSKSRPYSSHGSWQKYWYNKEGFFWWAKYTTKEVKTLIHPFPLTNRTAIHCTNKTTSLSNILPYNRMYECFVCIFYFFIEPFFLYLQHEWHVLNIKTLTSTNISQSEAPLLFAQ